MPYYRTARAMGWIGVDQWIDKLDKSITRVDVATLISWVNMNRVLGYSYDTISISKIEFLDSAGLTTEQIKEIQGLYYTGTLNGYPDGKFYPQNNVTRAEAVKVMMNIFGPNLGQTETGRFKFIYN